MEPYAVESLEEDRQTRGLEEWSREEIALGPKYGLHSLKRSTETLQPSRSLNCVRFIRSASALFGIVVPDSVRVLDLVSFVLEPERVCNLG